MKQAITLILTLCLAVSLCACGSGAEESQQTGTPQQTEAAQQAGAPQQAAEGFVLSVKGCEITMKAPAEPIIAALGEPQSCTEEPSCAFDGMDKTYYYGSFYMTTYPMDGKDYVYRLWFADDGVSTPEGISIGSTQAEVEQAYGSDNFDGAKSYVMTEGESRMTIIVNDGVVSSVQYEALFS